MEEQERTEERRGRWKNKRLIIGLSAVVLLLVAGGIVGSWLAGVGPLGEWQSGGPQAVQPVQAVGWPEDSPAAGGTIENLTGNTLDLREELYSFGGSGGGELDQPEVKIWQVVFSSDTRVFRPKFIVGEAEGEKSQPEELSVYDLEEGQNIIVWGEVNGDRIFADTIAIMTGGMIE